MSALRDRLRAKRRRTLTYPFVLDEDAERAARAALDTADHDVELAEIPEAGLTATARQKALDKARQKRDAAREAWEETVEVVTFTSLSRSDFEALVDAHPDPAGEGGWDPEQFPPALVAACAQGDMSDDEWREFLTSDAMGVGEVADLMMRVLRLNTEFSAVTIPKG